MINARARAIDSAILFFYRIYLSVKKLALSVVLFLLQSLLNMHTTNAIRKSFFVHWKEMRLANDQPQVSRD